MIRTWPGQTKEEWLKEYYRDKALTPKEKEAEWDKRMDELEKQIKEYKDRQVPRVKTNTDEWLYIHAEKPNSLDDGEATVSWIIIMVVGAIFNARWLIWIVATAIYLYRMNRYVIRQQRWENGGKEDYYKKIQDICKGDRK